MSQLTQITVPLFDGSDSADAEDFIHAIRAKAYSEGKDDDEAWILRLVRASLTRDALRWHTGLDPTIRKDWDLLEKALLQRFCTTFRGINGEECERFIHSLRRRIFEEGRDDDNDWITRFVSTCVVDEALRWHAELSPEIQSDWSLLQKAMLARYPPPEVRRIKSPTIPMAASAAPAPPSIKTGMIRLVDPTNPTVKSYLSRTLLTTGYLAATQTQSDAVIVEYDPPGFASTLRIKNLAGGFDLLGIQWYHAQAPDLSGTSSHLSRIVGISGSTSSINSSYAASGTIHSNVWTIASDGSIKLFYTDANGATTALYPRTYNTNKTDLLVSGEKCTWDGSGWTRMSFVFEAI